MTDAWTKTRDRWRITEPSPWQRFVARGESFLAAHPFAQLVASAGVLASAGIAVCTLFNVIGGAS